MEKTIKKKRYILYYILFYFIISYHIILYYILFLDTVAQFINLFSFHEFLAPTATISRLNFLWKISSSERSGRGWLGTMQAIHGGSSIAHSVVQSIMFLPIINMSPSDMICIFLTFIQAIWARQHTIKMSHTFLPSINLCSGKNP